MSTQDKRVVRTEGKNDFLTKITDGTDEVEVATHGVAHKSKGILLLGSDGTNNLRFTLDAQGHLQVDVLSSALPTGAATESTLATRLAESVFTGRFGEVDPSPTVNTLLGRLKAIRDAQLADGHNVTVANQLTQPLTDNELRATPVPVTLDAAAADPKSAHQATAALAAQNNEALNFSLGSDVTASLEKVTVSSPNPFMAIIKKVDEAAAEAIIAVIHGNAGATEVYEPKNSGAPLNQVASDATPTAKYVVDCKNTNAASFGSSGKIYVTAEWDEKAN